MTDRGRYIQRLERPDDDIFTNQNPEEIYSEFVWVSKHMKGYVIGTRGSMLQRIMQQSGTRISSSSRDEEGFTVIGNERQIAYAKTLILEIVNDVQSRIWWELVDIEDEFKRLVIGRQGVKLREINAQSGAKVITKDGEMYIILGNEEQRKLAKMLIGTVVGAARMRGVENKFNTVRYYIDGCNLQEDGKLKVEEVQQENHMMLPESHVQYNLIPANEYEPQKSVSLSSHSNYQLELMEDALVSLRKLKEMEGHPKADMWCHFGTAIIRVPKEDNVIDGEWSISDATEKLQSTDWGNNWKMAFREGVDLDERTFRENGYKETHEDIPYVARYDLSYLTSSRHQLRCKVWVAHEDVGERLQDIKIPFSDVKNILEEIQFIDKATRSRCRGWLVLKSRKYLQADILFPGCKYDCTRITIRGRTDSGLDTDYVPSEEVRNVLSEYLSQLTFTDHDEDGFGLRLPANLPEGFYLTHRRLSKRTLFNSGAGFSIILSKEYTWRNVVGQEKYRESTDLHIHCEEWDRSLGSGVWEPEAIVRKIPEFLTFVKEVQGLVVSAIQGSGLASTVPPEILARGPSAVDAYNKALADGKTSVKRAPIMLIGQDRAGKTSLKKSMRGICFDPKEDSTVGIDVDPSHFKVTTETWRTGTKEKGQTADAEISFDHHAALWIVDNIEKKNESPLFENVVEEIESSSEFDGPVIPKLPGPEGETRDAAVHFEIPSEPEVTLNRDASKRAPRLSEHNQEKFDSYTPCVPEDVAAATEKFLQGALEDNRNGIYSTLWDFAGQSVYYETHPLFLTARAIYCLAYDLSLNPHDRAKPLVKHGIYKKYQDSFNLKTNLDYLDFWMRSVASMVSDQSDDRHVCPKSELLPDKLPPVFLVCTHADEPYEDRDPTELAHAIFGCLKKKPYGGHLHDVFVVDNTKSGTKSECSEVMRLRQEVLAVAENLPHINETIPIKWLKFDKTINVYKENGKKYISLKEAKDIASTICKINDDLEIKTLIDYLHDLRSLIHFDDSPELNKLVVLDAQWLIDVFKKVITVKPSNCSEEKKRRKEKKFEDLWWKLEIEGILDEELLAHVWGTLYNSIESYESLIGIMDKFSLVCPWPSDASENKTYLVPSMLRTRPPKRATDLLASAEIPSLFIKFETGQVPAGLFPRLVLQFFQWDKEKFGSPEKPELFHSFARFFTSEDGNCSVILLCHSGSVEIVVHGVSASSSEDLSSKMTLLRHFEHETPGVSYACAVRRKLSLILEVMRNEFCWLKNMTYNMCVVCPVCCCGSAVNYCRTHHEEFCKEEQCLHFLNLSELCRAKEVIICKRPGLAPNRRVHVMQFAPWLDPVEHQFRTGNGGYLSPGEANLGKALTLPDNVVESLFSEACDSKMVVSQWKESLRLDQVSLENPDGETKALIRCLARKANRSNRSDVVQHLREISPAGTTGPLLPENLDVRRIPIDIGTQITFFLSGGDEWKPVAEKLGLNPVEIRYLDRRVMNPADALLAYIAKQRHLTVGEFYDVLSECGFPLEADRL